jgi:Flp pilus assembly protein TadD
MLRLKNDYDGAIVSYRTAIKLAPALLEAHVNLAGLLTCQGAYGQAIAAIQEALVFHPDSADLYLNLGVALKASGDFSHATQAYQKALALRPDWPTAYYNLGAVLQAQNRTTEAINSYRKALAVQPDWAEAYNGLGQALQAGGWAAEAVSMYERAIVLKPLWPIPRYNLAQAALKQGRTEQAVADLRNTIAIAPDFSLAHVDLALLLLQQGSFEEGWREYEWRLNDHHYPPYRKMAGLPLWDGSPLEGRTLLLWSEQGLGDTLQFVRYASLIPKIGGTVILQTQPRLIRLLQTMAGVDRVIDDTQFANGFDLHCPLLSLPRVFTTTAANIPAVVPYLRASAPVPPELDAIIDRTAAFKIGIVWESGRQYRNHQRRDCNPADFERMAGINNVKLFSLQVEGQKKLSGIPTQNICDLAPYIDDFAGSAAIVEQMDLIITVDTAMAHLAGGLGKRVWLLLCANPDWRWMMAGDHSPWYPTMRIFRQERLGDWTDVFDRLFRILTAEQSP